MNKREKWSKYASDALRSGVPGYGAVASADAVIAAEEERFGPLESAAERTAADGLAACPRCVTLRRERDQAAAAVCTLRMRVSELEGYLAEATKEGDEARHRAFGVGDRVRFMCGRVELKGTVGSISSSGRWPIVVSGDDGFGTYHTCAEDILEVLPKEAR